MLRALGLTLIVVLLFASSSTIVVFSESLNARASESNLNCKVNVCAYVSEVEAVVVVHGTKIVNVVGNINISACCEEGWDYAAGAVIVPGYASAIVFNATTNQIFDQVYSSSFNFPFAALYNPVANSVLVSNSGSNTLTVINASTWKANAKPIIVGNENEEPAFLAFNPVNKEIYVSLRTVNFDQCGNNVTVLDALTDVVVKTISVGLCPAGIAFNPTNNETYVGNQGGTISVINLDDKVVKTIKLGGGAEPFGVNYGDGKIYVCDYELFSKDSVFIVSPTNKVSKVSGFSSNPVVAAYDPTNHYEYVVAFASSEVQILMGRKISSHSFDLEDGPSAIITTANPV